MRAAYRLWMLRCRRVGLCLLDCFVWTEGLEVECLEVECLVSFLVAFVELLKADLPSCGTTTVGFDLDVLYESTGEGIRDRDTFEE